MEKLTTSTISYLSQLPTPWQWLTKNRDVQFDAELEIENLGRIRGKKFMFEDGRKVRAYLGVPYAKSGSFRDRFKRPFPIQSWSDTRDCTQFGPRSIQTDMLWDLFLTPIAQDEENCLHMNIFVPDSATSTSSLPVMVFVHGGGYLIHSSANYSDRQICRNLCKHDVIYRLGLLGFLSTGTSECPGNFGLWDLRESLLWIKKHIKSFGGNGENITAFGQSAGGACIDLLTLSPECEGLLKRCILMGGNAASDWAVVKWQRTVDAAVKVAKSCGYPGDAKDPTALLEYLRQLPGNKCKVAIYGKSAFDRRKKGLEMCPVIDGHFLPEPVHKLRKKAKPITSIIGTTDYEALLFVALGRSQSDLLSFEKCLKLHIPDQIAEHEELREEARRLYLHEVDRTDKVAVAKSFMRLYSDCLMNLCTHRYVEEMSDRHKVYLYNITYCNPNSFGLFAYRSPFIGATHCQDLRFLFGKGMFAKFRPNSDDLKILDYMTTMFTNFAKTGDPNYDQTIKLWKPSQPKDSYKHLDINTELRFIDNYQGRRAEFWKKLDKYREEDELNMDSGLVELD
ncbi:COesterase domain-containing protein [Aphelenchoides besseyi]|nr:COesterase domain-containing protein [Aphelenchoides besseyi]